MLSLISDIFLIAAAIGLAVWCRTLARRLKAFSGTEQGLAGTITSLETRIRELERSVDLATNETDQQTHRLAKAAAQSDDRIGRMEILLASLEDIEAAAAARLAERESETNDEPPIPGFRAARGSDRKEVRQ